MTLNILNNDRMSSALFGKTAVVTGSKSGFGAEVSFMLDKFGCRIIGIDAAYNGREIDSRGNIFISGDVCDINQSLLDEYCKEARIKKVNYIINTAGLGSIKSDFTSKSFEIQRKVIEVNTIGAMAVTKSVLPWMSDGGVIVNVSANAARTPYAGFADYSVSKAGIAAFSAALRLELDSYKYRIVTLIPGPAATPMQFENEPWNCLMHPKSFAEIVFLVISMPQNLNIEELNIRAVGHGEVAADEFGARSRSWIPIP